MWQLQLINCKIPIKLTVQSIEDNRLKRGRVNANINYKINKKNNSAIVKLCKRLQNDFTNNFAFDFFREI